MTAEETIEAIAKCVQENSSSQILDKLVFEIIDSYLASE